MPQSNYHQRCHRPSSSTQTMRAKSIQSSTSRDFDAYERYYEIKNTPDYNFRKENYAADEFIYKNRKNCAVSRRSSAPQYGSRRNKPLVVDPMCFISSGNYDRSADNLPKPNRAAPMKRMTVPLTDVKVEEEKEKPVDPTNVPMDWDNYHRLAVIYNFMDGLECEFPSLCTTGTIGKSLEGRDIRILKISNSEASNARVWIDAGIHAREWIAPAVNTFVANHIARNFEDMPASVRNKDWYFLPVLNPDGYEYSHTTDRMWRKNKAYVHRTLYGVDLNRNFSFGWGGKGSSDEPRHSFYRGPRPFSEPETSAMRDVFMNSDVTFTVYITLHSFGQVIIMPFAYREELAPDYIRLLEGATVMSKAIYNTNGNTYKVGISKDVMYHASGTSNDWSHGAVGIPFCYLIELRSRKHKFKVPKEEIGETGQEILNCVVALMEFIDNYKTPDIEKRLQKAQEDKEKSDVEYKVEKGKKIENREKEVENQYNEQDFEKQTYVFQKKIAVSAVGSCKNYPVNEKVSKERKIPQDKNVFKQTIINNIESESSSEQPNLKSSSNETSDCLTSNETIKVARLDPKTQVWEVHITDEVKRVFVKSLNVMGVLDIWKEHFNTMEVMVEGSRARQLAGLLHEKDINYSIAMPDVNTLFEIEQADNEKLSVSLKKMDWKSYHRLETIYEFMDNLAQEYPYICQVSSIGKTIEGRDIKMLKISNGDEKNIGVWLDGTIHAREWISGAVVTYIADKIVRQFNSLPECVTSKDWYIVPIVNPDGYEYTHTTDRMWRKNRTKFGECVGVDLNRNWGHAWGEKGEEGSSEDPGSIYYRGPKAFSERETAAIKHVILKSGTKFQVFLSLHCYGETIIFPWGYTTKPCPDYVTLLEGGTAIAKGIYATSGYTYKVGSTKDMMYFSAGTSIDWSYGNAKIPYSYMIELRGKEHRFLLPKEFIIPTATEVFNGVLNLLTFISDKA